MSTPNLDNTLGIFFDAAVIGAALYGAGCMQAWYYYRKYKSRDDWKVKSLVAIVMFLDTCQVATLSATVYTYLVTHHDEPAVIGTLFQTLIIEIVFSNLIAIFVQMFYVQKIFRLCDRKWYQWPLTILVTSLSWASFISLDVYIGKAMYWNTFVELAQIKNLSIACNALAAVSDFTISLVLVFLLRNSRSGMKKTNDMISRLILFTFNTGIPTSACALLALICINVFPSTFVYILFFLLLGRFYTNSLMALLNSRDYVRTGGQDHDSYSVSLDAAPKSRRGQVTYASTGGPTPTQIAIQMDTVKETDASEYDMEEAGMKANSLA